MEKMTLVNNCNWCWNLRSRAVRILIEEKGEKGILAGDVELWCERINLKTFSLLTCCLLP